MEQNGARKIEKEQCLYLSVEIEKRFHRHLDFLG
jgi:hypothetical protein